MGDIQIALPGKISRAFSEGITPRQVRESENLYPDDSVLAARVNGKTIDLNLPLHADAEIEFIRFDSAAGREIYWHSSAHLMAQAVKNLWPRAKLGFGPPIENGFYYDIDLDVSLTPEDLVKIEQEMERMRDASLPIQRQDISREEAIKLFKGLNEEYKLEALSRMDDRVSIYRQGDFVDLCRGPHIPSTDFIRYFKLLSIAGAYWLGDERNPMLQRIYGISYPRKELLDDYLRLLEEAQKRDHRKLGKELNLFSFHTEAPGFVFWKPAGMVIYNEVIEFLRKKLAKAGYQEIRTPIILNKELWRQSGHWNHYKENMYFTKIDNEQYAVKPMNCPGGLLVFNERQWSYKDLPVKIAELGLVHRHEKSGVLHGLFRVRMFTQDDAHVFCMPKQIEEEVIKIIEFLRSTYSTFGFTDFKVELSTRPEKSIGSVRDWENAEEHLRKALEKSGLEYEVNEGEGAFYGPKIDFHVRDSLARTWQCGTIQVDFSMPKRFKLEYTTSKGTKARPVMIHRAILGSLERFIGILIEHYGGDMPFWLAPVQAILLPIAERHHEFCRKICEQMKDAGLRVEVDDRAEKVGYKIRDNELKKIPYMLIAGDREQETGNVSVRKRKEGDLGAKTIAEFTAALISERDSKN